MKKLAIIGSGEAAVIIADEAKKMGIETHSFSIKGSDRVVGHSNQHHVVDIFDIETITEICKKINVRGVIATTELTIAVVAKVTTILGLNGMDASVANMITDKGYIRNRAKYLNSIMQPWYTIWDVNDKIPEIGEFPVIVKPTEMGGKRGVSVVTSKNELEKALNYAKSCMPLKKTKVIIEQYIIGGKEYSVESLSYKGLHKVIQITEKITSGPPHCVELGHLQPARIDCKLRKKIEIAIIELLTAVGLDNTSTHTEIKIVNKEVYLIEINARSGGDHIAYPLTNLSTGYSYIRGTIDIAMDTFEEPDTENFEHNACGVLFVAKQTAIVKSLFDECEKYYWLYKKNEVTKQLVEIINNNAFDTNYMIFKSNDKSIPKEIEELIDKIGEK